MAPVLRVAGPVMVTVGFVAPAAWQAVQAAAPPLPEKPVIPFAWACATSGRTIRPGATRCARRALLQGPCRELSDPLIRLSGRKHVFSLTGDRSALCAPECTWSTAARPFDANSRQP